MRHGAGDADEVIADVAADELDTGRYAGSLLELVVFAKHLVTYRRTLSPLAALPLLDVSTDMPRRVALPASTISRR